MGRHSKIEWCTATWNPWQGCHKVSPACAFCYAERRDRRLKNDFETVRRSSRATFYSPLKWQQPELIFTCSLSDFFVEEADEWRDEAWEIIHDTPQHIYLILTKRLDRDFTKLIPWMSDPRQDPWPNVCLMATAENQYWADYRTSRLLKLPARWYGLSIEPLLGPVELLSGGYLFSEKRSLSWVIVGGESGGPRERSLIDATRAPKPIAHEWVDSLYWECRLAGVPFLFKQWGGPKPGIGGRLLDGRECLQFPPAFEGIIELHRES